MDIDLLPNWFRNVKHTHSEDYPLWAVVVEAFAIGSQSAHALCVRYGYDPDLKVPGLIQNNRCGSCGVYFCETCETHTYVPEGHACLCESCDTLSEEFSGTSRTDETTPVLC